MDALVQTLLDETGSLGCKINELNRITRSRSFVNVPITIENQRFEVKVKISRDKEGVIKTIKPEYDDIKNISTKLKVPYKKVFDKAYYELRTKYN